jgi:peptidoglycan/LPS O-acetylase OafA/YrhL
MRIFFKGLNELRGFAAIAVVFHHIELYKYRENIVSLYDYPSFNFIERLGKNGVYLFFVLSGFLITYLLLAERENTNNIDSRKFYIRRILRIWPLYYLIVALSFFAFPAVVDYFELSHGSYYSTLIHSIRDDFGWKLFLFLFFLPNLALTVFSPVAGASQSWSVGVEEQFYLLWPQLLKRFSNILLLLIFVIVIKFGLYYGLTFGKFENSFIKKLLSFLSTFNIEMMALGGIGAYFYRNDSLKIVYKHLPRFSSIFFLGIALIFLWLKINYFLLGVSFLFLILLNINDKHCFFRNKTFAFFGDISYGIYMYHPLVMFFVFTFANQYVSPDNRYLYNIVIYLLIFGLSVLLSFVSYKYFESFFLRLKDKFVVIPSGKSINHE